MFVLFSRAQDGGRMVLVIVTECCQLSD